MPDSEMVRVNVMLSRQDLRRVDALAQALGISRSALLRDAIRRYPDPMASPRPTMTPQEAAETIRRIGRAAGSWDGAAIVRRWRDER